MRLGAEVETRDIIWKDQCQKSAKTNKCNTVCTEVLCLGGPITSNQPPVWFVCRSVCELVCLCVCVDH